MARKVDTDKPCFIIEHFVDQRNEKWHHRLDENKYRGYADSLAGEIKANVPGATVLFNQVPKEWHQKDLYCQLIPNDDDNNDVYDMIPRFYAFEVSTVAKCGGRTQEILLYSKIIS